MQHGQRVKQIVQDVFVKYYAPRGNKVWNSYIFSVKVKMLV